MRYYVQEGILDPPAGRGRGGFYYDSHLYRLLQIKAHQERGLKLSEIQKIFGEAVAPPTETGREMWLRYPVASGIEIHISRDVEEAERRKILKILRIAKEIFKGDADDD